jgi:hypothetical protein
LASHQLSALQQDFLRAFFQREDRFFNGIHVDPPQEILANELCALLSRSEIRDLLDVRALEMAGYRMEDALAAAASKDSGLTPAQLAWVLTQIEVGDKLRPPGGVSHQNYART